MESRARIYCCFAIFFVVLVQNVYCQNLADEMAPIGVNQETCSCGRTNRRTRIIGGRETEVNEYPWMIEILVLTLSNGRTFVTKLCGGALIDALYVVTAAHCFKGLNSTDLLVDAGDHDISKTTETARPNQYIRVKQMILHENYDLRTVANDIALLRLAKPVEFTQAVLPACMPPLQLSMQSQTITVTGHGATEQGGSLSNILNEVDLPTIDNSLCRDKYKRTTAIIDDSVFCAGTTDGSKDSCQGDSGSPAVVMCNNKYTFVGVVSFGVGCGNPEFPGVLSNVSYYRSWIVRNAVGASLCVHNCYPTPSSESECGLANSARLSRRIVGGVNSQPNQYPWMAGIFILKANSWSFSCGGTLISKDWVLTSAKCVSGIDAENMFVALGAYDINTLDRTKEQDLKVSRVVVHPDYVSSSFFNDIALLKLEKSAVYGKYVKPICLPSTNMKKDFSDVNLKMLGWGRTATNGAYSGPLKEVILRTMANDLCKQYAGYSAAVQPSTVCTYSGSSGDVCEGDSGGPLMTTGSSGRYYLAAVHSFRYGGGCGSGYPSGHIRIPYFTSWITQTTGVSPFTSDDVIFG